ncbi:IucA/IucC family protein [Ralstonia pseudosolanacearum]|uniref:IucA/IucC family protein n=1 Tax=Ralstonia solanacearum species complex TaxID=3116862 RepID=UPI0020051DD5|nr:IucA/IucC family protein [Ralstonia pseudosolanacearum]MCK4122694.1 siderophore biosynthesis protein [Ralstonia pseudosolanacearum]MCK4152471.1 siderophore biosynthesis protein [Ralstonia pseudosolanacearum]
MTHVEERPEAPDTAAEGPAGFADRIDRVLAQDLLDALWLEDLYGFRGRATWRTDAAGEAVLSVPVADGAALRWRGARLSGMRALRLSQDGAAVALQHAATCRPLRAVQTLDALQHAPWWPAYSERLAQQLAVAQHQMARTFAAEAALLARVAAAPRSLAAWEAVCCLRDRPFHPFARAKVWPDLPGEAFEVESGRSVPLHWVAVARDALFSGDGAAGADEGRYAAQPVAAALLSEDDYDGLARRAVERCTDPAALWLPVHPWQWRYLQRNRVALALQCVDLGSGPGAAMPTASLRTLSVADGERLHLKLALNVQALGAARTLPPRYLRNGVLAERCLEALRARDAWLGAHLALCGEGAWWALGNAASLIESQGELACMLRHYPAHDGWLLPMAACAAVTLDGRLPALEALCGDPALQTLAGSVPDAPAERAWRVFGRIAHLLIELGLRCFAHGVMPELHGQNVMLRIGADGLQGLVLRDHDTLRICPVLMAAAGVEAPDYAIDRSTPNTLILDAPEALLAYFQTLAVEVNLYAILAALAERYGTDESIGWRIVGRTLRESVDRVFGEGGAAALHGCVAQALFDAPQWPFKQILAPLAARASIGTGMPSGLGTIANPLRQEAPPQEVPRR